MSVRTLWILSDREIHEGLRVRSESSEAHPVTVLRGFPLLARCFIPFPDRHIEVPGCPLVTSLSTTLSVSLAKSPSLIESALCSDLMARGLTPPDPLSIPLVFSFMTCPTRHHKFSRLFALSLSSCALDVDLLNLLFGIRPGGRRRTIDQLVNFAIDFFRIFTRYHNARLPASPLLDESVALVLRELDGSGLFGAYSAISFCYFDWWGRRGAAPDRPMLWPLDLPDHDERGVTSRWNYHFVTEGAAHCGLVFIIVAYNVVIHEKIMELLTTRSDTKTLRAFSIDDVMRWVKERIVISLRPKSQSIRGIYTIVNWFVDRMPMNLRNQFLDKDTLDNEEKVSIPIDGQVLLFAKTPNIAVWLGARWPWTIQEDEFKLPEGWTRERTNTALAVAKAFVESNKRSRDVADDDPLQFVE
jgi:hypothetical protein